MVQAQGVEVLTCLYCPSRPDSREHVFPAGLGGRRVDLTILCEGCNPGLSPLDLELANQIGVLGSMLGVRRDHHRSPLPSLGFDPRLRRRFWKDHLGNIELAAPDIWETGSKDDRRLKVAGTQQQLDRLRHAAKQAKIGGTWGPLASEEGIAFDLRHRMSYGSKLFRRAVAKIAVHVLAWRYPELARRSGTVAIRDWIKTGRGDYEGVWHDFSTSESHLPPLKHALAHRVVLAGSSDRILARVTFFRELSLAVDLGVLTGHDAFTHVFDFDPLAERPEDLVEHVLHSVLTKVSPRQEIRRIEFIARLDEILQRAASRHWHESSHDLIAELNSLRTIPFRDRTPAVFEAIASEPQSIFALLSIVSKWARSWYPGGDNAEPVRRLRRLVRQSRSGIASVHSRTWELAGEVAWELAEELSRRLVYSPLGGEAVRALLEGIPGVAVALRVMVQKAGVTVSPLTEAHLLAWRRQYFSSVSLQQEM